MRAAFNRRFPRRYRISSSVTGPGIGVPYRSKWVAAFWATTYDWLEWGLDLPRHDWKVEKVR